MEAMSAEQLELEPENARRSVGVASRMFEEMLRNQFIEMEQLIVEEHRSALTAVAQKYEVVIGRMRLELRKNVTKQKKTAALLQERQASQAPMSAESSGDLDVTGFESDRILDEKHEQPPATSPATLVSDAFAVNPNAGPRAAPPTPPKVGSISHQEVQIANAQELSGAKDTNGTSHKTKVTLAGFDDGVAVERDLQDESHPKNRDGDGFSNSIKPAAKTNIKPKGVPDDDPMTEMTEDLDKEGFAKPENAEDEAVIEKAATMSWILNVNKKRPKPIISRISCELFPEEEGGLLKQRASQAQDGSKALRPLRRGGSRALSSVTAGDTSRRRPLTSVSEDTRENTHESGEDDEKLLGRDRQSEESGGMPFAEGRGGGNSGLTSFGFMGQRGKEDSPAVKSPRFSYASQDSYEDERSGSYYREQSFQNRGKESVYTTLTVNTSVDSMFDDSEYAGGKKTFFENDILYGEVKAKEGGGRRSHAATGDRPTFAHTQSFREAASRLPSRMQDIAGNFNLRECWWTALEDRVDRRVGVMSRASKRGMLMKGKRSKSSSSNALRFGEGINNLSYREMQVTEDHWLQKYMLHPHSRPRVTWSMAGIILVLYDIVTVPLLVFEIPALPVWALSLMTVFWTTDIVLSLFTGYEVNGQMEMRPKRVMQKYVRTWMGIDFFTVVPEWIVIFYETSNPEAVSRLGDTFRFSRIFRCARVIRVLKMRQFVEKIQDRLNSENSRAFFGILKHMVYIVIINHFLACAWYAIGNHSDEGWVHKVPDDMPNRPMGYRYLTSLHWSLSQLHGTMEVHPYTIPERLFATVVLILAVLCASWIVSSITNMMIQVQQARESYIRDKSTLRRYLAEYHISTQLSMQVKSYADELLERQRTKAREVHVLAQLPPSLRMDIEYEIHSQTLHVHALFHAYCSGFLITIRTLCHSALTTAVLFQGNQVFVEGEAAKSMFFVIDGSLTYTWRYKDIFVSDGEWLSESVLWINWVHCGDLTAAGMCNNMLTVNAEAFLDITMQHRKTRVFTAGYAESYVSELNQVHPEEVSDIFYVNA